MRTCVLLRYGAAGSSLIALAFAGALVALAQGGAAPEIVPRPAWRAKPANTELMKPQTPHEIVIHHTSLRQQPNVSLERKLRSLQRFSQSAGSVNERPKAAWGDVPYHFYIDAVGRIGEGRDVRYAGDSNTNYDMANRIHVVLEGQFDNEQPSPAQLQALDQLVIWLADKYQVPASKISGHNDHVSTECPGKSLKAYLPTLREKVAKASVGR